MAFCAAMIPFGIQAEIREDIKVTGDWEIMVTSQIGYDKGKQVEVETKLAIDPPEVVTVTDERYDSLPVFNPVPHPFGWDRGVALIGLRAAGCTTRDAIDPTSIVVREVGKDGTVFERGKDYDQDDVCGAVGRLEKGRIGADQPVLISYRYVKLRIDSVVRTKAGKLVLRKGTPHIATPHPPALEGGEVRVANIWLPGRPVKKLTGDNLFPILETTYPEPPKTSPTVAERLLPKTMKKLQDGTPIRILAWGDSVTECGWLPDNERWQDQFVARLKKRFPKAKIELIQQGWGGKNTELFLSAPPGHPHNYKEKILGAKPDLVISEFFNDLPLTPEQVQERYSKLLADFQAIGAEWIIVAPHYGYPMFPREREIDDDPRPYIKAIREFAPKHGIALADVSARNGRLWRQGLPYSTFLSNNVNHPDVRGMAIFGDALMQLFP